ncbi:ABC transporter ATP-binding protein [Collinsella sp. An2]|uniref:ABC transporter ATP-binding protein n=1 Tax=Collinsella sp. An2 TaxID=1965585 RepID=UPI000B36D7AB|nr:ABC transporter ATP-binding protein [Collinsella sp. An2]OUP09539.1 ABC transporter ATP-binding protein [Collinsella sp. An2]
MSTQHPVSDALVATGLVESAAAPSVAAPAPPAEPADRGINSTATEGAAPIIAVRQLVKRYGDLTALDHFDLTVHRGEIFGLLGPNGCGKTTAINCMLQLLGYQKGTIELFGERMTPTRYDLKRRIGIVPQQVAVFEELTVTENIDAFCSLYVSDCRARRKLVEDAIAFTGLGDFRRFRPRKLSGGLLRRLNIACGIAHRPELIFFDEPTVAVDPQSRNAILGGILHLVDEGATVVYTSHYMEEVEQICSRVMIMDHGRTVAEGTVGELKAMIDMGEKIVAEVPGLSARALEAVRYLPCVLRASYRGRELHVACAQGSSHLAEVLGVLNDAGAEPVRVYSEPPTLNDVFLEITGSDLRDSEGGGDPDASRSRSGR